MTKILIVGNSGSGKSTLAKALSQAISANHIDLDSLAWQHTTPPTRRPAAESLAQLADLITPQRHTVIEGCYGDLLSALSTANTVLVYLDLPATACIKNAKQRPWESHKYPSKEAQDANLAMLLGWIESYYTRDDDCAKSAHDTLYNQHTGAKLRITTQAELNTTILQISQLIN